MTRKDVAIIGGSFDPVHNAHIEMIKFLVDNYIVDEVLVLPSYYSPHKDNESISSFNDRVNMLNLAIKDIKNTYVDTFEEDYYKANDTKTYTYEVLNALKEKYINTRFHFVVGFDSIKNINTWHRYKELLNDYWFYIFDREDDELKTMDQKKYYLDNLGNNLGIKFIYEMLDTKISNISSTQIREMLKDLNLNKGNLFKVLDKDVLKYIEENKLYGIR